MLKEGLTYSNGGYRVCYDADLHPNHGKKWTTKELAYLCHHYESKGTLFLSLKLGRTQASLIMKKQELSRDGQYEHFKDMYHTIH